MLTKHPFWYEISYSIEIHGEEINSSVYTKNFSPDLAIMMAEKEVRKINPYAPFKLKGVKIAS